MKYTRLLVLIIGWVGACYGYHLPNALPNRTIEHPAECGPRSSGFVPAGTLNQVFLKKLTPSDLTCYPYDITEPGHYVLTRDFVHELTHANTDPTTPLIRILASHVTIDFQTFALYQESAALDIKSNLIEIGNGTDIIRNITLLNGILSGANGVGILIKPNVANVSIKQMKITNCLFGGVVVSGAQNIELSHCWITDHAGDNTVGVISKVYLDDILAPDIIPTTMLGAFSVFAYNTKQLAIRDSELSFTGLSTLSNEAVGLYCQECSDVEFVRSVSASHQSQDLQTKGIFLKECTKGLIDCSQVSCNKGNGVVGIDLIDSDTFHISNTNVYDNQACGDYFVNPLDGGGCCPVIGQEVRLFTRCSPCDTSFTDRLLTVDFATAYTRYKAGLALPMTDPSCVSNWQTMINAADWTTFMDAFHAIDYTLEYYTYLSRAYGIRLFDTKYITLDKVSVINTTSLNNSAWGIFVDKRTTQALFCTASDDGMCNIIRSCKVMGTHGFIQDPTTVIPTDIEILFGDILDETSSNELRSGESLSMLGRSIGIELRNCVACNVLHNNLVKGTISSHSFVAGIFLNRSSKSDLVGNRIECNCGIDIGYGILNRTVDPTDLVSSTTLFANGYTDGATTGGTCKNINYGVFWTLSSGTFSIKHVFTNDLTMMNNIGTHENVQILFDTDAQLNLPCIVPDPDIVSDLSTP